MTNQTNEELREIHNNKQNLVYIEMKIMDELQKVAAFGYSMANTVGLTDFMRLNNECNATDYQQSAHNIVQLLNTNTNKAISDVLDRLLHNSKRPICLCDTPYKNGVVSVDAIQQERNKLKEVSNE